jgi:hypothetical protein
MDTSRRCVSTPRARPGYKKLVFAYAEVCCSDAEAYRFFEIPRSTFYSWKRAFRQEGIRGLVPKRPVGQR